MECEVANCEGCCTLQEEELAHDAVQRGTASHVQFLVISHCLFTAYLFSLHHVLLFSWFHNIIYMKDAFFTECSIKLKCLSATTHVTDWALFRHVIQQPMLHRSCIVYSWSLSCKPSIMNLEWLINHVLWQACWVNGNTVRHVELTSAHTPTRHHILWLPLWWQCYSFLSVLCCHHKLQCLHLKAHVLNL